ncbi:MAG: hypothetical protein ACE5HJ_03225 [Thermoplasmata archaeon]
MTWDAKAALLIALIWAVLSVIYVSVIGMMPGARAWGAGAVIFAAVMLAVWCAERQGARRMRSGEEE